MPNRRIDDELPAADKLHSIADFLGRLTLGRVFLGLLFCAGIVGLYGMWETRAQWAPMLIGSQALLIALLVGGVLIAVGAAIQGLQKRADQQNENLYLHVRDQLSDLRRENGDLRADLRAAQTLQTERDRLAAERDRVTAEQMTQLIELEQECQRNLIALRHEVADVKRLTGFGDLG